jgi:hypothetical protein
LFSSEKNAIRLFDKDECPNRPVDQGQLKFYYVLVEKDYPLYAEQAR